MPVSTVNDNTGSYMVASVRQRTGQGGFSGILTQAASRAEPGSSKPGEAGFIELGKISKETPTVSHILKNHPEFADKCWDIIYAPENRGKEFTKINPINKIAIITTDFIF